MNIKKLIWLTLLIFLAACMASESQEEDVEPPARKPSDMVIHDIIDNREIYESGQIPAFEAFEATFQIDGSVAQNFQFPYDSSPPSGIDVDNPAYQGITVNAIFTPDNWETTYQQPAFYYQEFKEDIRDGREWYYPTTNFSWKVRFSPPIPGEWQYKISAEDASGYSESSFQNFTVSPSSNRGFVRVSSNDPRYFEFDDGTYFPGLGYNLTGNQINASNPYRSSQTFFQKASQNGIQFFRYWLPVWGIYTSAWNPWRSITPAPSSGYIPFSGLTFDEANHEFGSETSMVISNKNNPCMFIGWLTPPPAVKPDTNYHIRIRFLTYEIDGPRIAGNPHGLVAKVGGEENGGWLWGDGINCNDPGTGIVVSEYQSASTKDTETPWQILEGSWHSDDANYLPYFYLVMENVNGGRALIDYVWIEEDLGGGKFGPNILPRPWMSHHLYFEHRSSITFDKIIEAVHEYDIYLKLVTLEKNEWTMNHMQLDGSAGDFGKRNQNFYGDWRQITKVRWLQQAWWRYIQARWGYSPNIHSWELLNEGDPASDRHYAFADEFGKYMHCRVFGISVGGGDAEKCNYQHPNSHLVSTSFWHSFPTKAFWAAEKYPNLDFADLHAYNSTGQIDNPTHEVDAALYHLDYSQMAYQKLRESPGGSNQKPVVRGEAGIDFKDQQVEQPDLDKDQYGVWLHNFLWSSLDSGGMIEQYWWNKNLENQPGPDGEQGLYEVFNYFQDFIADIPLNNGFYVDAEATVTNPNLRVIGQKDTTNIRAHLWVQNKEHTWRNVVDGISLGASLSGDITIDGFPPDSDLTIKWFSFDTKGIPSINTSSINVDESGRITLQLPNAPHITDIGIKIE
jgi:hypothetical protein